MEKYVFLVNPLAVVFSTFSRNLNQQPTGLKRLLKCLELIKTENIKRNNQDRAPVSVSVPGLK